MSEIKMNLNHIKGIHKWNKDAGLSVSFDKSKEIAMLLEELYEAIGIPNPKQEAREFVAEANKRKDLLPVEEVDFLDALCDIEFILHGSKCKMGLSPQQDIKSIETVLTANLQKLSAGQDEHGKQKKPADFIPPEERLQQILDERQ